MHEIHGAYRLTLQYNIKKIIASSYFAAPRRVSSMFPDLSALAFAVLESL